MLELEQAYEILFAAIKPGGTTVSPLDEALYRTLASPVRCDLDSPPFDRSVMDGYAVRAADVATAPTTLRVVGKVPAGARPGVSLHTGDAVQINTGAPIPPGADAVVPEEETEQGPADGTVVITAPSEVGRYITRQGAFATAGQTVLTPGTLLTPLDIGVAATVGAANLTVYHRPTVAILSTGDELVDVHETPSGAQIRNSNLYLLQAMVRSAHAVQVTLGAVADDRELLRARVAEGLKSDVVCISGGVSVGPLDYVPEILERCGATLHIRKLAIKPGRPLIFGTTSDGTLVFGLPGNPTSAFVCFELLVKPALAALQGRGPCKPRAVRATLCGSVKPTGHRRAFVPARASVDDDGRWRVSPVPWGGSGDSIGLANANGLIVRSPNTIGVSNGEEVLFIPLDRV